MTCNNCIETVSRLLLTIKEIVDVKIDLKNSQADITMSKHVPVPEMQKVLIGSKYSIAEIDTHKNIPSSDMTDDRTSLKDYLPVFLIFLYITTVTVIIQLANEQFDTAEWMRHFMAGFFLVFSFFKLLDITAFASSYSSYDIVAKRFYSYGYVYPFIELGLGIGFLIPELHLILNVVALLVMSVSIIGVIQSMLSKRKFQCACLGAFFKLPLSKITLFEDGLMIIMSLTSILIFI